VKFQIVGYAALELAGISPARATKDVDALETKTLTALDKGIISFKDLVFRLDETLPMYVGHAEAPEVFPKVLALVKKLSEHYGPESMLKYEMPNWMKNM